MCRLHLFEVEPNVFFSWGTNATRAMLGELGCPSQMVVQINLALMAPMQALVFMLLIRLATMAQAASLLAIGGAKVWAGTLRTLRTLFSDPRVTRLFPLHNHALADMQI